VEHLKNKKFIFLLIILSLICANISFGEHVLINSKDWRDVYSGMVYANLNGDKSNFLTSTKHSTIILGAISKESDIFLINSRDEPYIKSYRATILASGYDSVEDITTRNSNLDLAERLEDITNFIVIDDSYGYNSISVAAYAVSSRSYVLFADEDNIDDVYDFLSEAQVDNLIIFGSVDRDVKTILQEFNPEIINEGDRFDNNLKIIDKYVEINPDTKQVYLSNGEFIEDSLIAGDDPVIFIGKANVPDQVREYIKSSQFQVATLIGNELIGAAQFIKRQIGIPVFVKFAQGARTPTGTISQVEDLDRFPMPQYNLNLGIYEIKYNRATNNLEVTYENFVDLGTYFIPTITVSNSDGEEVVLGSEDCIVEEDEDGVLFIDKGSYKTLACGLNIDGEEGLNAYVYTLFGESRKNMEYVLEGTYNISIITILDDTSIVIKGLVYDESSHEFIVEIENTGDVDVWVSPEIIDLIFNDDYINYGIEEPIKISAGKSKKISIPVDDLTPEDIEENELIRVKAYYGERETSLFKVSFAEFEFQYKQASYYMYVIIIVLILLFILFEFGKKKCPNCKHKNKRRAKRCVKCHHKF